MLAGAATLVADSRLIRSENANLERRLAAQTIKITRGDATNRR
jgi:hypothetical protein